jgi:hypothetical protein
MSDNKKIEIKSSDKDTTSIPTVDSRKAGQVGQMLEGLALAFKEKFPDREVRWVYSPLHRGELSNIMTKRAQGYKPVFVKDIGTLDGFDPDEQVRISDLVLMSIPKEVHKKIEAEVKERADEQLKSVEQEYYDKIGTLDARDGADPRMRPAGRAVIEERDHEYEIEQR